MQKNYIINTASLPMQDAREPLFPNKHCADTAILPAKLYVEEKCHVSKLSRT